MKVLIVGATFNSNFGDLLFSHLFYDKCKEVGFEKVAFWQWPKHVLCDFCRNELDYQEKISIWEALRYDALILQSGGMMGEPRYSRHTTKLRFLRFVLPCLIFTLLRKPVYVLGSGGSPIYAGWLRRMMVFVLNHAKYIAVRNQETHDYYKQAGVKNTIHVTSDTAQIITSECLPELSIEPELEKFMAEHKLLLLQFSYTKNDDRLIAEKLAPAINRFLNEHPEYGVILTTDKDTKMNVLENSKTKHAILPDRVRIYHYHNSWQLAALINRMDVVVSTTLHVGIVGSSLGKSVLSFSLFFDKAKCYYKQIGEAGRCLSLREINAQQAYEQLQTYQDKPILLPAHLRELAASNLNKIEEIAKEC